MSNIEVTKQEAIAAAMLAKMIGREVGHIGGLTTNSGRSLSNTAPDVDKMLSEMTIVAGPKPEGPVMTGSSVDGEVHEVVLHKVEHPVEEQPIDIMNPFAKKTTAPPTQQPVISMNSGASPMASFMGKAKVQPPSNGSYVVPQAQKPLVAVPVTRTAPETPAVQVHMPNVSITDASDSHSYAPPATDIMLMILEKLVKIELAVTKIQKQLKKNTNENKAAKG